MAEDYRVGDGHVTDLRCVIVNMKYFCFESKKNLLELLNHFCQKKISIVPVYVLIKATSSGKNC